MLDQFVRMQADKPAFDYDLLSIEDRVALRDHIKLWAQSIDIDFASKPNASNAERVLAIADTAMLEVRYALPDDDEVAIDHDTVVMVRAWLSTASPIWY